MQKPKLIAIDIDGTLSTGDPFAIPEPVLQRLNTSKHHIVLASGRTINEIKTLGFSGGMIGGNGGTVIRDGQTLFDSHIELDVATKLIDWIKENNYIFQVHSESEVIVEKDADILGELALIANMVEGNDARIERFNFVFNHVYNKNVKVTDVIDYIHAENHVIKKIEIFKGPDKSKDIEYINNNFNLSAFSSVPTNIEIVPKDVNKGTALRKYNFDDKYELYTIGDGDNDLPMFAVAKASFAVDNGSDLVKEAATYIVPSVADFGVLQALDIIDTL
ncbi:HAD-IIB family hydrolase [Mollicutes bacterium LVI A0039]|nr:HAD-IIB family hydrolase [Mollicutes bacterium LVI A0039]